MQNPRDKPHDLPKDTFTMKMGSVDVFRPALASCSRTVQALTERMGSALTEGV